MPGVAQDAHMMGHPRLLHPKDIHQLADAELAPAEEEHDPQAGRVGQGPEDLDDIVHGHWMIPWAHRHPPQAGKVLP